MRLGNPLSLLACLFAIAAAATLTGRATAEEAPVAVTVRADQADGRMLSDSVTNASLAAIYSQTTTPLADAAFGWVRATNALSYVRCYNWLGDGVPKSSPDWFSGCRVAKKGPDGAPVYQWDGLERALDVLVSSGVKPMIVCAGMPDVMAAGPIRRNEGGAAANRPANYLQYQDMLTQMFRRLVKTYGAEEVRTWYFEVWSQPDHEGSWEGGRPAPFTDDVAAAAVEPFNKLYDHFAAAALTVDEKLRIGGPGLAGDVSFLKRFLEHCARGTNSVTGKPGARLDFVSWNRYGTVADIVRWNGELRAMVERDYPEIKGAQFILSECGSGSIEGARSSTAYEAARMAALLDANARAPRPMDLIFRAGDLVDDHFGGFRSLITRLGDNTLPLPAFRFYMMLSKMGSERLKAEAAPGVGVLATRSPIKSQRNASQVLLYRYDPSVLPDGGNPVTVKLKLTGLPSNLLRLPMRLYRVDAATHAVHEAWEKTGRLRPAPDALGRLLLGEDPFRPSEETPGVFINSGEVSVDVTLQPNSVVLVTFGAEPDYAADLCPRGQRLRRAEDDLSAAAELQSAGRYEKAIDELRAIQKRYADTYVRQSVLYALVGIYELDLKSPDEAEGVRKELLAMSVDDFVSLGLVQRLRVDRVRRKDTVGEAALSKQIADIEARLKAQRDWPLKRYVGQ